MNRLVERLNRARVGGAILFCGAGFSADCLSFKPGETLGTGAQLLDMCNEALNQKPPFSKLQNAADALWDKLGDYGMEKLLKERFTVSDVTTDMTDLLRYPWQAVYTTNYDNALELAAQAAKKSAEGINNTDDPSAETRALPIIHLHGYVSKWDIHNIRSSCVLGAESYQRLGQVKRWTERFRRDVDMAQIVVFVGFNAADFHLNQAIYDLTGLREKAFFINRPAAEADPDVAAEQRRLGIPLYVGRSGLANAITTLLKTTAPNEPRLASFTAIKPAIAASQVPTAAEIEDLFLYGKALPEQLARDMVNGVSDYHIRREVIDEALMRIDDGKRILLFTGYPCDGKSLLVENLAQRLLGSRPVYKMIMPYESLLNEVASILHHASNAVLIIENCLDLPAERLESIARQIDGTGAVLILTSLEIAVDATPVATNMLQGINSFHWIALTRLTEAEGQALVNLADQITGWREFRARGSGDQLRFVMTTCKASLPHFLMQLLKSQYVAGRYREEFNKLSLNDTERRAIILALYVTHIGENAPVSFLSDAMKLDFGAIIDGLNRRPGNDRFQLVRRRGRDDRNGTIHRRAEHPQEPILRRRDRERHMASSSQPRDHLSKPV